MLQNDKISYELSLPKFDKEVISVTIDVCFSDKNVGRFKCIFDLSGEILDEVFVVN